MHSSPMETFVWFSKTGHMDAFFQLGMLHLKWANSEHTEVEDLQKRHRQLTLRSQQHQKEAAARQQQRKQKERARLKASRRRQLKERQVQKKRQQQERLAREKFNARMAPKDAAMAETMASDAGNDGENIDEDEVLDDEEENIEEEEDEDEDAERTAEEARRATEKQQKDTEAATERKAKSVAQNLQKGLQFLTTAAQNGHILSLHQIGMMYQSGRGVSKSCGTAAHAFKSIGERAAEPTAILSAALQLSRDGDLEGARLL